MKRTQVSSHPHKGLPKNALALGARVVKLHDQGKFLHKKYGFRALYPTLKAGAQHVGISCKSVQRARAKVSGEEARAWLNQVIALSEERARKHESIGSLSKERRGRTICSVDKSTEAFKKKGVRIGDTVVSMAGKTGNVTVVTKKGKVTVSRSEVLVHHAPFQFTLLLHNRISEWCPPPRGKAASLCELCCGAGVLATAARQNGVKKVTAVDIRRVRGGYADRVVQDLFQASLSRWKSYFGHNILVFEPPCYTWSQLAIPTHGRRERNGFQGESLDSKAWNTVHTIFLDFLKAAQEAAGPPLIWAVEGPPPMLQSPLGQGLLALGGTASTVTWCGFGREEHKATLFISNSPTLEKLSKGRACSGGRNGPCTFRPGATQHKAVRGRTNECTWYPLKMGNWMWNSLYADHQKARSKFRPCTSTVGCCFENNHPGKCSNPQS